MPSNRLAITRAITVIYVPVPGHSYGVRVRDTTEQLLGPVLNLRLLHLPCLST